MEFSSKGFQRNSTVKQASPVSTGVSVGGSKEPVHKKTLKKLKGSPIGSLLGGILFVSAVILFIAIIIGISTRSSEGSYVQKDEYQAVFLEGGQVYFGKLKSMKENHFNLTDIYYLNVNDQSVQPDQASQQNLSLVKLGCELHGPRDQMIINREQVLFWENLKNDSRVVTAIKEWQSQNKDGQKCDEQNAAQQQTPAATTPSEQNSDENNGSSSSNQGSSQRNNTPSQNTSNTPSSSPTNNTPTSSEPAPTPTPTPTP